VDGGREVLSGRGVVVVLGRIHLGDFLGCCRVRKMGWWEFQDRQGRREIIGNYSAFEELANLRSPED